MKQIFLSLGLILAGLSSGFDALPALAASESPAQARLLQYQADTSNLAALAAEGTTVVFFFATWCPNCVMTLTELSKNWEKVDPSITLVIADYDIERDLKARFGVTYQDTFVLLDGEGQAKKLWNAGGIEGLNRNASAQ